VVEDVTRRHQAEVYEMKTVERPEIIIAVITLFLLSRGKFFETFSDDQSSRRREQTKRTGIVNKLL
jgi:formate-dependent nitrite reductase membrane component NrfD